MAKTIQDNLLTILRILANLPRGVGNSEWLTGAQLREATLFAPEDINDAVNIGARSELIESLRTAGTSPFTFRQVRILPRGRYELERLTQVREASGPPSSQGESASALAPPLPVGSPYGFNDADWESVARRKAEAGSLNVVFGFQFSSGHYNSEELKSNVKEMFDAALSQYALSPGALPVSLSFRPLAAGYGEHLFNQIARDIIASDIAVFETSDLNPNVMLELGVALT